jgi:hypothetical protein
MKTNIIIYQPGYGGTFLQYLFSLDNKTVPYGSDPINRLDTYLFDHAEHYPNWEQFHLNHTDVNSINLTTIDDQYTSMTISVHPTEFYQSNQLVIKSNDVNTSVYLAELSHNSFNNFWLVRFKEKGNGYPCLRPQEIVQEEQIRTTYIPVSIHIDKFLDPSTWSAEYLRINDLMGLTPQLESAEKLYESWYKQRVEPFRQEFNQLTIKEIETYSHRRILSETASKNSTSQYWYDFYNSVRGDNWPDCDDECNFHQLPAWIQQELIEKFDYFPG